MMPVHGLAARDIEVQVSIISFEAAHLAFEAQLAPQAMLQRSRYGEWSVQEPVYSAGGSSGQHLMHATPEASQRCTVPGMSVRG